MGIILPPLYYGYCFTVVALLTLHYIYCFTAIAVQISFNGYNVLRPSQYGHPRVKPVIEVEQQYGQAGVNEGHTHENSCQCLDMMSMISLVCAKMWAGNRRVGGRGKRDRGAGWWEALLPGAWREVVQFGLFADGNTAYAVVHPYPHPKRLLKQKEHLMKTSWRWKRSLNQLPTWAFQKKCRLTTNINM